MILSLNTLRAIAALIVVVTHYSKSTGLFHGYVGRGSGQMGVMLFFIISGFLMSYLYLDPNKPFNKNHLRNYLISRASRVLPLYLILVFFSFILIQLNQPNILYNIPTLSALISHLLLLKGVSVFWTIPPEIHFYLFFVFLWFVYQKSQETMFVFLFITFLIIVYLDSPRYHGSFGVIRYDFSLIRSLPYFFVGLLSGLLYRNWQIAKSFESSLYFLSLIIIPFLFPDVFEYLFGYRHGLWQDPIVLFVMTIVFFCFVFLTPKRHWFVANPISIFLGKISYSIYLLHMPVLKHFKQIGKTNPEFYLPIYLVCTTLIAYVSYLTIEKPIRNYLNKKFKKSI